MVGGKVCVAFHHCARLPAAKLLQFMRGCPLHSVPACPRVPQIMPAKIFDAGTLQGLPPCSGIGVDYRFTGKGKDPCRMFAELPV